LWRFNADPGMSAFHGKCWGNIYAMRAFPFVTHGGHLRVASALTAVVE
jgi:hypothetical protein